MKSMHVNKSSTAHFPIQYLFAADYLILLFGIINILFFCLKDSIF
jgi:hypothetical protein